MDNKLLLALLLILVALLIILELLAELFEKVLICMILIIILMLAYQYVAPYLPDVNLRDIGQMYSKLDLFNGLNCDYIKKLIS